MYSCIDSSNNYYTVDEYCLLKKENKHPKIILCPFCGNTVFIRAENSQERTHFMHGKGTSCSNKTYKDFFNTPGRRKTQEEITVLKHQIFINSFYIWEKIYQYFSILLPVDEFLSILNKLVNKHHILTLINITSEHMPYVITNELGHFNDINFLYTNYKNASNYKLWNLSDKKDCVLCVTKDENNKISRYIIHVNLEPYTKKRIPMDFVTSIIPGIFNSLQIENKDEDQLIKELLKHV